MSNHHLKKSPPCILCNTPSQVFFNSKQHSYYQCPLCNAIFIPQHKHLVPEAEKERYLKHSGIINQGYRKFVQPLIETIENNHAKIDKGLDYGAGHSAIVTLMLAEKGYSIDLYDPYFHINNYIFAKKYDFIVCCEVIEHFNHPKSEFVALYNLLENTGKLHCKTEIYSENINFASWYYKNDPTHVIIYTSNTLAWIKEKIGFSNIFFDDQIVTFSK